MKKVLVFSLFLMMINIMFANPFAYQPLVKPHQFSLLNPNKLTINHSMSFSGGLSSNNFASYQSTYATHFNYDFSKKLNLKVDLNFVNYGTSTFNSDFNFESNDDNNTKVLPDFSLEYKPTENTIIKIQYISSGGVYSPFYRHDRFMNGY